MKKVKLDFRKLKRIWSIGDAIAQFIEDDVKEYHNKNGEKFSIQQVFWSEQTENVVLQLQEETHKHYYYIGREFVKRDTPLKELSGRQHSSLSYDRLNWCPVINNDVPFGYLYLDLEYKNEPIE